MKPVGDLVRELVRRQVFRAAGAYVVVAWVLVQVASIVFPEFDAPPWSMRALIILLIVAFPLAMLVAWTVDVTNAGLVRTPESGYSRARGNAIRLGVVMTATLMSAGVLWWVWADYIEPTTRRPERSAIKAEPIIAVSAPVKLSGSAELDWLGDGIATLLMNDLAESRAVIMLSRGRWEDLAGSASDASELTAIARDAGIDYLVGGEYLQTPTGIVLTSWVEDIENGNVIHGSSINAESAADAISSAAELAMQIKRALNIPLQQNVNQYAADFAVNNIAAYEAYVAGLGFLGNFDYENAEASFAAALRIAPDFYMARFRYAGVLESTGRSQQALDELNRIPADAVLTERERLYIDGAKSSFIANREPEKSISIYSELVEKYPYDIEGRQHLADAYWLDFREDEAIEQFRRLVDIHSYSASSWMALGERLLDVGRLDEAEPVLLRYDALAPEDAFAIALLGKLELLRGNFDASARYFDQALQMRPGFAVAMLGLARSRFVTGEVEDAERLLMELVRDDSQAAGFRIDAAFDLSGILRGRGRFDDAMRPFEFLDAVISTQELDFAAINSALGALEMERGNFTRSAELIDIAVEESQIVPTRHLFARGMLALRTGDLQRAVEIAGEIQAFALPPDDPDRTEDKAAAYLLGHVAMNAGDLPLAESKFREAIEKEGFRYGIYELGLADALYSRDQYSAAADVARSAIGERDAGDLRLDLEIDRSRALLLLAKILEADGNVAGAGEYATQFLARWQGADDTSPEETTAREILSAI